MDDVDRGSRLLALPLNLYKLLTFCARRTNVLARTIGIAQSYRRLRLTQEKFRCRLAAAGKMIGGTAGLLAMLGTPGRPISNALPQHEPLTAVAAFFGQAIGS